MEIKEFGVQTVLKAGSDYEEYADQVKRNMVMECIVGLMSESENPSSFTVCVNFTTELERNIFSGETKTIKMNGIFVVL